MMPPVKKSRKRVVLGVTGSIAIYKACEIIRQLKKDGFAIDVIMTKESEEFIRPFLFQSLSGNKVYSGLFETPESMDIEHISLAEKADLIVIVPATANIIGKIASGICDDLLSCVVCAASSKVLLCPAMNERMYRNPIVQSNIKKLKSLGYIIIEPRDGMLACGKAGIGCLADADIIVKEIKRLA